MLLQVLFAAALASAFPQNRGGQGGPPGHGGPPVHSVPSHPTATFSAGKPGPTASGLPWAPAGEGDVRSPCPALNTLANHYLLPHSGKGITTEDVINAFAVGQNFAADTVTGGAAGALALCSKQTGTTCTTWDLDMLDQPHAIEHDNSLSREDYNFGRDNNTVFSPQIWGQVLRIWERAEVIDYALANAARAERVAVANATDVPGWYVSAIPQGYGETAFYMSLFGDASGNNAPQSWINVWFEQERMPFELGWTATQRDTITAASLAAVSAQLMALDS